MNITSGTGNISLGYNSGLSTTTGSRNVLIGQQADVLTSNFNNAIAIGSEAIITAANKMILGNDSVNVGIGLSNDQTTPSFYGANNKLEIDAGLNGHAPSNGGTGLSGLRFRDLHAGGIPNYQGVIIAQNIPQPNNPFAPKPGVLSVDVNGDVILVEDQTGSVNADNGCSTNGPTGGYVHLGNSVGNSQAALQDDREIPMANHNIIFSGQPDNFPGKVGFGIVGGINSPNPLSLRPSPITMQVNGSLSIFDGTGNTSIFFGEEQHAASAGTLGEWGIQYSASSTPGAGGLNFWKPSGTFGYNFGNKFLYLCDNGNVGIGATAVNPPGNALEITSYPTQVPSGLRFTNLTSGSTPLATNPGSGVLAVNASGDVVYVPDNGGNSTGFGYCPNPTVLTGNAGIDLSGKNFYYEGQSIAGDYVGIGYTCGSTLGGKLDVLEDGGTTTTLNPSIAIKATNKDVVIPQTGAVNVYGVYGDCRGSNTGAGIYNIGGYFIGQNANTKYNIGVMGEATAGNYAGYFKGDVYVNSPSGIGVNYVALSSDSNLKTNITPINHAQAVIHNLKPKSFYFDTNNTHGLLLPSNKQYGFLAQDVKTILPELVTSVTNPGDSTNSPYTYSALNYNAFIGLLTAGMQEQQLSIDSLRNAPAGSALGNICGNTQNPIYNSYEIPTNGNAFLFSGTGRVGIGNIASCAPSAKLHIRSDESSTGALVENTNSASGATAYQSLINDVGSFAVLNKHSSTYSSANSLELINQGGDINIHNDYDGDINLYNFGAHGINLGSVNKTNLPSGTVVGVHSNLIVENDSPGLPYMGIRTDNRNMAYLGSNGGRDGILLLYPYSDPTNAPAVFMNSRTGESGYINTGGNFGFNTNSPGVTLDVNGTVRAVSYATSDSTLKTNIVALSGSALDKVKKLRAVSYEWIDKKDTAMYGTQYGFTAQQVETIVPDLVKTDSAGKKVLSYNGIIAFLTKAMQEQQAHIDHQDSVISALAAQMDNCCNNGNHYGSSRTINTTDVELSDADAIVLNQNEPNPFAEQTTISYNIPKSVMQAQILFYDVNGRLIQTVDVSRKGKGQLNVFANDLSNGVYSYTLIADGKIIETKKMVKQ